MKRLVLASAIASSIAVTGCATNPYGYNDGYQYDSQGRRVATGAAIGGATGAVVGAVVPGVNPVTGAVVGAVLGGCVQDMTILFLSTRRNGRSLGQMAREELGPIGGYAAMIGTLVIMIILIAVLGLVVVNAMRHSPWATSTVFATIPIAILIGLYLRNIRPGRVLEASLIGVALLGRTGVLNPLALAAIVLVFVDRFDRRWARP